MPKKFSDSDATRIITALEARQGRKTKDGAQVSSTWGTIGAVDSANKFASAYLYGETDGAYMSEGFRIPETMYLTVGDVVKVSINYATGERWVSEAHFPSTAFKKLALDLATGAIMTGDGSAPPTALNLTSAAGPDADIAVDAAGAAGTTGTFARSAHGHRVVTTDAPSGANITVDAAASAAATGSIARAAHGHRLNTYSSTPAASTVSGSAGTSTTAPARGDHAHPLGETSNTTFAITNGGTAVYANKRLVWSRLGPWVFWRLSFDVTTGGSGAGAVSIAGTETGAPGPSVITFQPGARSGSGADWRARISASTGLFVAPYIGTASATGADLAIASYYFGGVYHTDA